MVDIVKATKAIWANWADGTPLDHLTDFHRFDLMTPIFVPHRCRLRHRPSGPVRSAPR